MFGTDLHTILIVAKYGLVYLAGGATMLAAIGTWMILTTVNDYQIESYDLKPSTPKHKRTKLDDHFNSAVALGNS